MLSVIIVNISLRYFWLILNLNFPKFSILQKLCCLFDSNMHLFLSKVQVHKVVADEYYIK